MSHIVFTLFALAFLQLVKSQSCETARDNLNFLCVGPLNTADPSVCSGPCSSQLATVAAACANSVSLIQ